MAGDTSNYSPKVIIGKFGFKFAKSLGQNFLVDMNIPDKIVRLSGIDKSDCVLEVGPGFGALTSCLSRAAGRVIAVELDGRLTPILGDIFSGRPNVEIIHGNILKTDIAGLIAEKAGGLRPCACANLPYSITTPALSALIDAGVFDSITVMVQREVAGRLAAKPGTPEYGAFSVYVAYHAEPRILFDVSPECFVPKPKVFSSVVTMKMRADRMLPREDEAYYFRIVRAAFGQRRKTLVNALFAAFGATTAKERIARVVEGCGLDPNVRGEALGPEDFVNICKQLSKNQKES